MSMLSRQPCATMATPTCRAVNITATLLGIDRRLSIVILLLAFLIIRHVSFVAALAAFSLLWWMAYDCSQTVRASLIAYITPL
jgi:hypothetical protein